MFVCSTDSHFLKKFKKLLIPTKNKYEMALLKQLQLF